MEYAAIAAMVISALSPFVKKGLEVLSEKAAEEGFNERKAIWEKVKGLLKYDDLTLLNLLKEAETDVKAQGRLEGKLETQIEASPDIAQQLQELLQKIPQQSLASEIYQDFGKNNKDVGIIAGKMEAKEITGKKK